MLQSYILKTIFKISFFKQKLFSNRLLGTWITKEIICPNTKKLMELLNRITYWINVFLTSYQEEGIYLNTSWS